MKLENELGEIRISSDVFTYNADGTVSIELHIIVENGVNLMAVCRSIMSEVRYVVSKTTGVEVASVDVCVDSMRF